LNRGVSVKLTSMRFTRLPLLLVLAALAVTTHPTNGADAEADRIALAVEALTRLEGVDLNANATLKGRVLQVLEKTRGTPGFVKLVQHFKLPDQEAGLLEVAAAQPSGESGVEAMRLVLSGGGTGRVQQALEGTNIIASMKIAEALGNTGDKRAVPLLLPLIADPMRDAGLRKQAVRSLARTAQGAGEVLKLAKEGTLADDLKFTAGTELNAVRWPEIKTEAAKVLPPAQGLNAAPLPPLSELLKMKGDPVNGARIYTNASPGCANCHVVNGRGVELGPNLSEIGTKLGRDALIESILDPSSGISFGYEAWNFTLKNGDEVYGLIASETADEVVVKNIGGIVTRLKKSELDLRQQSKLSIMPAGLQAAMSAQELMDLIDYLASLKKAGATP
jgi:putative heme-binding domain-containing protein